MKRKNVRIKIPDTGIEMASAETMLGLIGITYNKIHLLNDGMRKMNGPLRDSYISVIKSELYNLVREIDQFKQRICEEVADIDTNAIMNVSKYPNMSY
jgi:hypothetical protein